MSKIHTKGKLRNPPEPLGLLGYPVADFTISVLIAGERELVEFLTEEIVAERKAQKKKALPAEVDGFKVKLDGADVELIKDLGKEK